MFSRSELPLEALADIRCTGFRSVCILGAVLLVRIPQLPLRRDLPDSLDWHQLHTLLLLFWPVHPVV